MARYEKSTRRRRLPVAFIAWSPTPGRAHEIANALGGEARCWYDLGIVDKRLVPVRYFVSAWRTIAFLASRRPAAVIATTPPVFPALIAWTYCRLARAPLIVDSHPLTYGFSSSRALKLMRPASEWVVARAEAAMVTDELAPHVRQIGGHPVVVHEAPPEWLPAPPVGRRARPQILFVTIFASDEPVSAVLDAARLTPEVDILVTGDIRKMSSDHAESGVAENVRFVGFLDQKKYVAAIKDCDIVMALTDRREAVSRVASEAVWAQRPLIASDWPITVRLFPHAVRVDNSPESIAAGIRRAVRDMGQLESAATAARQRQLDRWNAQLSDLRAAIRGAASSEGEDG